MRIFRGKRVLSLILAGVFCGSAVPVFALVDDDTKGEPSAKSATAAKVEAPAPLAVRERWLLDRVEQLEKRVADLESKGNLTSVPAADASSAQPASANLLSPVAMATPSIPGTTPPSSDSLSHDRAAAVGPQATEKGKSGAGKPASAAPFAFADFTWLNRSARTKESPMDTKFFTPEIRADAAYVYSFNSEKTRQCTYALNPSVSAVFRG